MKEEEGKMITDWLDKHGNPEIEKQVEKQLMDIMALEEAKQTAWMLYEHVEGNLYSTSFKNGFELGAKWKAERMYYEEEVVDLIADWTKMAKGLNMNFPSDKFEEWFEQFKKK
jgi:hypothetical protein